MTQKPQLPKATALATVLGMLGMLAGCVSSDYSVTPRYADPELEYRDAAAEYERATAALGQAQTEANLSAAVSGAPGPAGPLNAMLSAARHSDAQGLREQQQAALIRMRHAQQRMGRAVPGMTTGRANSFRTPDGKVFRVKDFVKYEGTTYRIEEVGDDYWIGLTQVGERRKFPLPSRGPVTGAFFCNAPTKDEKGELAFPGKKSTFSASESIWVITQFVSSKKRLEILFESDGKPVARLDCGKAWDTGTFVEMQEVPKQQIMSQVSSTGIVKVNVTWFYGGEKARSDFFYLDMSQQQ